MNIETTPEKENLKFIIDSLTNLGCQPKPSNTNSEFFIKFKYQGEDFLITCAGRYVRIWEPFWYIIRADDPCLPKLNEAVNFTNYGFGPTIVMSHYEEGGVITLNSRYDIMLNPTYSDSLQFLTASLEVFSSTKEEFYKKYQQLKTT